MDADDEDTSFAIAAILALGAFGLFAYPVIDALLGMSDQALGVWAGLAVDNTAEANAAGALFSEEAGNVAVLVKTTRNAMIGFIVLAAALIFAARAGRCFEGSKAGFVWTNLPKFVLGFWSFSGGEPGTIYQGAGCESRQLESLGLSSHFRWRGLPGENIGEMKRLGFKPSVVGALAERHGGDSGYDACRKWSLRVIGRPQDENISFKSVYMFARLLSAGEHL